MIKNLIYHVCPLTDNDLWKANLSQLVRRLSLFDGRRVVAIATGTGMHPAEVVESTLVGHGFEILYVPNDRELREVATFLPLLETIADSDPHQVTWYGHTKGNSTACGVEGATYWRNAMYHHLLDRWRECIVELDRFAVVGTHKMVWLPGRSPFPTRLENRHHWIFAGTFFWFRHDQVFTREWRNVPRDRYGAEAWPGNLFPPSEGKSVYQPRAESERWNPYDPEIYPEQIPDDG